MKPSVFGLFLASLTLLPACPASDDGGATDQAPRRDDWRTVINQPFPFLGADGVLEIGSLTIGGTEESDNFANRGDIIVRYAETDFITVEMRRFTMATTDDLAEDDFDALEIWAYDATGSPKKPSEMEEEDNCRDPMQTAAWLNDCRIRVYYDGQTQLGRAGADLRVTLPAGYIGSIEVTTEDNAEDSDYHNRGNVCIENLPGSADVALGNGNAFVILAPTATEIPLCPAADQATCEQVGWDPAMCPCLGGGNPFTFASTKVSSLDAAAADVIVDIPAAFWASVNMTNEGEGQTTAPSGNACADGDGACCDAVVDPSVGAYLIDPSIGSETTRNPWRNQGSINYPGEPAVNGAGYNIQLTSKDCQGVTSTENPEEFLGKGLGTEQDIAERGNLTVCAGCLRAAGSCEDLLPGDF